MSGTPLHGWTGAWRLFWSFLWRQALVLLAASAALGLVVGGGRRLGVLPGGVIVAILPWTSTALLIYSCVQSFRFLLGVYEVRVPGGPHLEQDRRHRR